VRVRHDVKDDGVIGGITVMAVTMPVIIAQVQLNVAVHCFSAIEGNNGSLEIRPGITGRNTRVDDANQLAITRLHPAAGSQHPARVHLALR
jgi:hypothetical protein